MKRNLVLTIALLLAAPPAVAEKVQLGWRTVLEYDSELVAQNGGQGDMISTFGPTLQLSGEHRRFTYQLRQNSSFEKHAKFTGLDDFRHEVGGQARFQISPRVSASVTETFSSVPFQRNSVVNSPDGPPIGPSEPSRNLTTGSVLTNVVSGSLNVIPAPRWAASSQVTNIFRTFDNPTLNSQNSLSTSFVNQLNYTLNESHSFGAGARVSVRDFQAGEIKSTTSTWEAFASWNWRIDPRSTLRARFGPSGSVDKPRSPADPMVTRFASVAGGLLVDPATCPRLAGVPVFLPGLCGAIAQPALGPADQAILAGLSAPALGLPTVENRQNNVNLFFAFTLNRTWDHFDVTGTWSRGDSQIDSLGSGTVVDNIQVVSTYRFTSRLRLRGTFRFTRRTSDVKRQIPVLLLANPPIPIPGLSVPAMGAEITGSATFDNGFKQVEDSSNARLSLQRDVGRYSSVSIGTNLRRDTSDFNSSIDAQDLKRTTNSWEIVLSFTYRFRPVRF